MTIQEAIRSGKRCRRKTDSFGNNFGRLRQDNSNDRIVFEYVVCKLTGNTTTIPLILNDILADDWEIEREPREIWVGEIDGGTLHYYSHEVKAKLQEIYPSLKPIKFREVIE